MEQTDSPAPGARLAGRVAEAARRQGLFEGVERLLVGCSGGGDSVALLHLLLRLAPEFGLELAVAHLHHGWRGADADADAEHVAELAAGWGLECFVERVEAAAAGGSLEEAGRRARLRFFADVAGPWEADAVALGHTADDQAETVLLNLARGTGLRGLGGMRRRAEIGGTLILRPLLDVRRDELRRYAREVGVDWREDSSNADPSLTRNRIRLRLLPELEAVHPGAVDNIVRAASLVQEEYDWSEAAIGERLEAILLDDDFPGAVALDATALREASRPAQRRLLRRALEEVRGHRRGLAAAHVESVLEALENGGAVAWDLPGVRLRLEGSRLRLLPLEGRRLAGS